MKNTPLYEVRPINNLKEMLNSSVELYGNKPAFLAKPKEGGEYKPILFKEYKADVDAFGTALISLGLKGKRIALIGENRYEWSISYLAVLNGTGIIVPLDKELPKNEIANLLTRSKANAIIFTGSKRDDIKDIARELNTVDFYIDMDAVEDDETVMSFGKLLKKGHELVKNGDRSFIDAEIDNEAMNILLFTSGTTDTSKAVMLSHKNICANLMAMCQMVYIDDKDIFLSVLPIHHTYECTCGFLCQLYRGCTVAYCEGLRHIPKNLAESKATMMLGVPLIFEAMYKRIWDQASKSGLDKKLRTGIKISNLLRKFGIDITKKLFAQVHNSLGGHVRLFISGAAGIDPLVSKGFRDLGIPLIQGYGLTECAPIVALNRDVYYKDDAAGLPLPGVEVKIDHPDADGVGEIIAKGPNVMLGYYEDEKATSKALKNGWFHTGDLGYIDSDGFVHITGREKDVIVTKNGKNIYPEEIETLLNRSDYIKESLVYGKMEEGSDEVTVAAEIIPDMEKIQAEFNISSIEDKRVREIIQNEVKAVNKKLVTYKYVKEFQLREKEFAKTTTKKIKRYLERKQ
ncbi:AMP-binding protein [Pseudoclostridium thermosuccinogenes]|jgi:long-chain acyl-CoA synthetase|uniref:AMP-dependent synthetase/ligase n=1 Tax=Clostridium thermosuccinogenes TaxID=84032 RepID=UPI002FD91BC2